MRAIASVTLVLATVAVACLLLLTASGEALACSKMGRDPNSRTIKCRASAPASDSSAYSPKMESSTGSTHGTAPVRLTLGDRALMASAQASCTAWGVVTGESCAAPVRPAAAQPAAAQISPSQAAEELLASLDITAPKPVVGPSVAVEQWGFVPVGYPVWLSAHDPNVVSSVSRTVGSLSITIRLGEPSYRWDMGDGTTFTCRRMTAWSPRVDGRIVESPDCGHVYRAPGNYVVRLTTTWPVAWSAGGQAGTLTLELSDTVELPVGELHSLVTHDE